MNFSKKLGAFALTIFVGAGSLATPARAEDAHIEAVQSGGSKNMVGYYIEWGVYGGFFAKNLVDNGSINRVTHILYAFSNLPHQGAAGAGTCQLGDTWADYQMPIDAAHSVDGVADGDWGTLRGNFNQLLKLKKVNPNAKVMISVGGWTWSSGFSAAASTDASRKKLVSSCVDTFIRGNFVDPANYNITQPGIFDGIDIDWEFPGACGNTCDFSPDDTVNFTLLLQEFRRQLDAQGLKDNKHYLLSIAAPAGSVADNMQLSKIHQSLDFVNLMTYDIHGGWDNHSDHAAPLFTSPLNPIADDKGVNADAAVTKYLNAGIPPKKLNMGIPFFGHGWVTSSGNNNGLYQPATGVAPMDQANYVTLKALPGFFRHYDALSGAAQWIFNPATHEFYSFDDPVTAFSKALYIRTRVPGGLGGAMFWDLSGDDAKGSLVQALFTLLH